MTRTPEAASIEGRPVSRARGWRSARAVLAAFLSAAALAFSAPVLAEAEVAPARSLARKFLVRVGPCALVPDRVVTLADELTPRATGGGFATRVERGKWVLSLSPPNVHAWRITGSPAEGEYSFEWTSGTWTGTSWTWSARHDEVSIKEGFDWERPVFDTFRLRWSASGERTIWVYSIDSIWHSFTEAGGKVPPALLERTDFRRFDGDAEWKLEIDGASLVERRFEAFRAKGRIMTTQSEQGWAVPADAGRGSSMSPPVSADTCVILLGERNVGAFRVKFKEARTAHVEARVWRQELVGGKSTWIWAPSFSGELHFGRKDPRFKFEEFDVSLTGHDAESCWVSFNSSLRWYAGVAEVAEWHDLDPLSEALTYKRWRGDGGWRFEPARAK